MNIFLLFIIAIGSVAHSQTSQEMQLSNRIEVRMIQGKIAFFKCRLSKCSPLGKQSGYTKNEISTLVTTPPTGWLVEGKGDRVFALLGGDSEPGGQSKKSVVCEMNVNINGQLEKAKKSKVESSYIFKSDDFEGIGCHVFEGPGIEDVTKEITSILSKG